MQHPSPLSDSGLSASQPRYARTLYLFPQVPSSSTISWSVPQDHGREGNWLHRSRSAVPASTRHLPWACATNLRIDARVQTPIIPGCRGGGEAEIPQMRQLRQVCQECTSDVEDGVASGFYGQWRAFCWLGSLGWDMRQPPCGVAAIAAWDVFYLVLVLFWLGGWT